MHFSAIATEVRGTGSPRGYRQLWATWHRCWEPNLGPLQEKYVLLTYDRSSSNKKHMKTLRDSRKSVHLSSEFFQKNWYQVRRAWEGHQLWLQSACNCNRTQKFHRILLDRSLSSSLLLTYFWASTSPEPPHQKQFLIWDRKLVGHFYGSGNMRPTQNKAGGPRKRW